MKKFLIIIAGAALLALPAIAVTNVATAIESESLPADAFRPVINKAVYDTVNTDVPALVAAINAKDYSAAPFTIAGTQLVFTASAATMTTATNASPTASIQVRLNGTNYLLKLFPN